MGERVDYVVVGLGALGSAAAWQLARRGHSVVGLEQFALGHDRGASHDTSRILRHSYHTPAYVELTLEAYADWADLEEASGERLVTTTGTTDRAPLPGLDEDERTRHKGDLVYPNLMLSASADHVAAYVLQPLAVDRTRVTCTLLFAADELARPTFDPTDAADLWDLVNKQDWAICEAVQRGMSSRAYTHGWFAPMEDDSLDIRRWLLPRLEARRG